MSDIKLFRLIEGRATELEGRAYGLEKPLQNAIERNLKALLGIRFLASEYSTGKRHGGRIDTLGIDEDSSPVIIEYKRSLNESVINQGLFYLDWLMDHRAEFTLLVLKLFGQDAADRIDWSAPRVICIAADFTRYDEHAVQQIEHHVELIRYRQFGDDLLLFEQASTLSAPARSSAPRSVAVAREEPAEQGKKVERPRSGDRSYAEWLEILSAPMRDLLASLEDHIQSLGDDVQRKELKLYLAFKRLKNFASIVPQKNRLLLFLNLNPDRVVPWPSNARDGRKFGHWGTGDLELSIAKPEDLDAIKPLIQLAYEGRVVESVSSNGTGVD